MKINEEYKTAQSVIFKDLNEVFTVERVTARSITLVDRNTKIKITYRSMPGNYLIRERFKLI